MPDPVHLYISGDRGSRDIRARLADRGIAFVVHDIRKSDGKGERVDLKYLIQKQLTTVPQLFGANGEYIGDYDNALTWINFHTHTERVPEPA